MQACQIKSPFHTTPEDSLKWHTRMTQDSDEAMKASMGRSAWQMVSLNNKNMLLFGEERSSSSLRGCPDARQLVNNT